LIKIKWDKASHIAANIAEAASRHVRFWHKADITTRSTDVRFGVKRTLS
jgi:hypothetical protein